MWFLLRAVSTPVHDCNVSAIGLPSRSARNAVQFQRLNKIEAVAFLVSGKVSYISGIELLVDGDVGKFKSAAQSGTFNP